MKQIYLRALCVFCLALAFASCGTLTGDANQASEERLQDTGLTPPETEPFDDGLSQPVFNKMPPEARGYLEKISRALRLHDERFLLAQGEASFAAWAKKAGADNAEYLACLLRAGELYEEKEYALPEAGAPRLDLNEVIGIRYLGWSERGPLIEARGRIITEKGGVPALLLIVWKLEEPKLQGYMR